MARPPSLPLPRPPRPALPSLSLVCLLASIAVHAQTDVRLDPETLAPTPAGVVFQFESAGGAASDFQIWSSQALVPSSGWQQSAGAVIEALAPERFRALVPHTAGSAGFFRVRRTTLPPPAPAPVLNEVMSDNVTGLTAADGVRPDWIELYNPHETVVSLGGLFLADTATAATPRPLPDLRLQPGAFLLIHAREDAGHPPDQATVVVPLALSNQGDTLTLLDASGREVDRVVLPPLGPDQSIGRAPDGAGRWALFTATQTTPGAPNPPAPATPLVAPAEFAPDGGFHADPVDLRLSTREPGPGATLRYTLDGSPPTSNSPIAPPVLVLPRTTLVRATVFDAAGHASDPQARTFFVGPRPHPGLPIVSLGGPPAHFEFRNGYLFGMGSRVLGADGAVLENYPFSGSNAWLDREAEVFLELLEPDGAIGLRQLAGLKVYGGWGSRAYPQKSLALHARREYGAGSFRHDLFPGTGLDAFESFVLRNSGNDNQSTHQIPPRPPIREFGPTRSHGSYFVNGTFTLLRDGLMQRLLADHTSLDLQAYRPAVVYLNGAYWGLYNLREKLNEHYVLGHHELPRGSIDLIEGYGDARAGDAVAYRAFRDQVSSRDMAVEANFRQVADTWLEVDNFIDYHLAVLFFQNFDIGNVKCWRPRTPRGRFRWMVYDQDYGFGLWPAAVYQPAMARDYADYTDMFRFLTSGTGTSTAWPNAGGRTLLLRRLLANAGFRERFVRRLTDLLNTAFHEERVGPLIDSLAAAIQPEIPAHLQRWSWDELSRQGYGAPYQPEHAPFTAATWETNLVVLHDFAGARPSLVRTQCAAHFRLSGGTGTLRVEIQPPGAGSIRLNSLHLTRDTWQGRYFSDLVNDLRAVPNPGFASAGWTTPSGPDPSPNLSVHVAADATLTFIARFEPAPSGLSPAAPLRIAEFNYHAPNDLDADDWIEIHNPGPDAVDLDGWVLRDQQDDASLACVLPRRMLQPGAACVVARRIPKFQWAHPQAPDPIATFRFGLGNDSDTLRLFDPHGVEVERIEYRDEAPWPTAADGAGSTLQRQPGDGNPSEPTAWSPSPTRGGTPGR